MKVIVAGGRDFDDYALLTEKLNRILSKTTTEVVVVCGMARGADELGYKYAKEKGYSIKEFPADWETHGRSAGYKRNEEMAVYADALVAFWDGKSKGTKHMIDLAKKHSLQIRAIRY